MAPTMAKRARIEYTTGRRCTFVVNADPDLSVLGDRGFGLVLSVQTIQHLEPELGRTML